jgi:hypothetical protein
MHMDISIRRVFLIDEKGKDAPSVREIKFSKDLMTSRLHIRNLQLNPKTTPQAFQRASRGLAGKVCATLGRVREQNGVRFACIQSGSKEICLELG